MTRHRAPALPPLPLFDTATAERRDAIARQPYGGSPPSEPVETSQKAAQSIAPLARSKREAVYRLIVEAGERGRTDDELESISGWRHQTVSARRRELVLNGAVIWAGRERNTRSGCKARVWIVAP